MEKSKTYLRIMSYRSPKTYQIIKTLSDPYETDSLSGKPPRAIKVDYIMTQSKQPIEIRENVEFAHYDGKKSHGDDIIEAGNEEYNSKIKRASKLFIKRLFQYGVIRK